jgi:hypothetical protein
MVLFIFISDSPLSLSSSSSSSSRFGRHTTPTLDKSPAGLIDDFLGRESKVVLEFD